MVVETLDCCMKLSPSSKVWNAVATNNNNLYSETKGKQKGWIWPLLWGLLVATIGVVTLIWTPFDLLMQERTRMRTFLPPFKLWIKPKPDPVLFFYLYNVTNSEEFMAGNATRLKVQEIGPVVYNEEFRQTNVRFNENSTMTYTTTKILHFQKDRTPVDMNASVIVPNLAYLGVASFLSTHPFYLKMAFKVLSKRLGTKPFVTTTIYNWMWNFTDPVLPWAKMAVPHLVPISNLGVLKQLYLGEKDNVTVLMGPRWGSSKFFQMDKYNGRTGMNKWEDDRCDNIQGSTEAITFSQDLKPSDSLFYFRKSFCRKAKLEYQGETEEYGLKALRFGLPNTTYDRPVDGSPECFYTKGTPVLPQGLTDVAPCYFNFPIVTSFPHMWNVDKSITDKLDGLEPNLTRHKSYLNVEPFSGVPLAGRALGQSNLYIRPLGNNYPEIKIFEGMAIPIFWVEYKIEKLPDGAINLLTLAVKIVKPYQTFFSIALLCVAILLGNLSLKRILESRCVHVQADYSLEQKLPLFSDESIFPCKPDLI